MNNLCTIVPLFDTLRESRVASWESLDVLFVTVLLIRVLSL